MKPLHILLVEDNEGDILLTTEALEDAKLDIYLSVMKDGKEAMNFLDKQDSYTDADTPDLILLDINLPRKNGHEVLRHIKESVKLRRIPVIMLTTSASETDINLSYDIHANCFITKPVDVEDFLSVIKTIENFWIYTVKLPNKQ